MLKVAQMMTAIGCLVLRDKGQDLLEYGLLAALIAVVTMAGVRMVGDTLYTVFWSGIGQAI
jgi:Flp pilus assembly pilin Flp